MCTKFVLQIIKCTEKVQQKMNLNYEMETEKVNVAALLSRGQT